MTTTSPQIYKLQRHNKETKCQFLQINANKRRPQTL